MTRDDAATPGHPPDSSQCEPGIHRGSFSEVIDVVRNIMDKDENPDEYLIVKEIDDEKQAFTHSMSRWDLLLKCRRLVAEHSSPAEAHAGARRSDFFRSHPAVRGGEGIGKMAHKERSRATLQFRDLRCLQGITEPVIHVRDGAVVASFDPIRAVITCANMFVVLHEGEDSELQPLMPRLLYANDGAQVDGMIGALPFELQALDAVLYTAFHFRLQVCTARVWWV